MADLVVEQTPIPGLLVVRLPLPEDNRGWFKENWQREKMVALGLPDFGPVQNNIALNNTRGVTRGIHAEPWDKYVSVATGRVFGAWVDLREGASFGTTFHTEIDPTVAVFVPRGVANAYQALEDATAYTYLVNDHWRPGTTYPALNPADPTVAVPWPIPLAEADISEKDKNAPTLDAVTPMRPKRTLILGAHGQLGHALRDALPRCGRDRHLDELDLRDADRDGSLAMAGLRRRDQRQRLHGRRRRRDARGPTDRLGSQRRPRPPGWRRSPATTASRWCTTRPTTSSTAPSIRTPRTNRCHHWASTPRPRPPATSASRPRRATTCSARRGSSARARTSSARCRTLRPAASAPAWSTTRSAGSTFATELARATRHLIDSGAEYGTYNVSNGGPATSWADVAKAVFRLSGRDEADVTPISTEEYAAGKAMSPRPLRSMLDLGKLEATGFVPVDAREALEDYLRGERRRLPGGRRPGRRSRPRFRPG